MLLPSLAVVSWQGNARIRTQPVPTIKNVGFA